MLYTVHDFRLESKILKPRHIAKKQKPLTAEGPFIFYELEGGGGLVGFRRACKKIAFKGGHPKKIRGKGDHVKYLLKHGIMF